MNRSVLLGLGLALLTACGSTNPFMDDGSGGGEGTADTAAGRVYGTDLNADLTMNALVYRDNGTADPTDDTLLVNNLPFDNTDSSGGGYTRAGTLPNGFERYESPLTGAASDRQYFAVFRRSTRSQVAAVGTDDYVTFGFGGATAQRLGTGRVPAQRPAAYVFTGDYAAVRVTRPDSVPGSLRYVTGDATLYADIVDFDVSGAVEGIVSNRRLYDQSGAFLGTMGDYISLATGEIDFTNAAINSSTATSIQGGTAGATGEWRGVFSGPNGEEIAGILVIEGSTPATEPSGTVRETGSFIVVNGG